MNDTCCGQQINHPPRVSDTIWDCKTLISSFPGASSSSSSTPARGGTLEEDARAICQVDKENNPKYFKIFFIFLHKKKLFIEKSLFW
jgi:hypothetical protein